MTKEELLIPRTKIINGYPQCPFEVGLILYEVDFEGNQWFLKEGDKIGVLAIHSSYVDEYPHLFKRLQWWEERANEDMPKYLRDTIEDRVIRFDELDWEALINPSVYIPATQEEWIIDHASFR